MAGDSGRTFAVGDKSLGRGGMSWGQAAVDLTTGEVVARLKKDWAADIKAYDEGHEHMLMFADMLTEGIQQQFPVKFKGY